MAPGQTGLLPFPVFAATWVLLGVLGFYLFYLGKDADFKRKWFPRWIALIGVLFVLFIALTGFPMQMLLFGFPGILLISWLNIRQTRFCSSCGRMVWSSAPFTQPDFCSKRWRKARTLEGSRSGTGDATF